IPEILESILLQLDMRTLLTAAQLVCHEWRALITQSCRLQEKLFFRPRMHGPPVPNPLLAEVFPLVFPPSPPPLPGRVALAEKSGFRNLTFRYLDMIWNPRKQAAYTRTDASWRRMLIRQPPV
ncbi:F-box protein, partial [Aspergillus saccharolyticus JOP 1030-1]